MKHPKNLRWLSAVLLPATISTLSIYSTQAVALNALHTSVLETRAANLHQEDSTLNAQPSVIVQNQDSPILIVEGHFAGNQDHVDFKNQALKPIDSAHEVTLSSAGLIAMSSSQTGAEPESMTDSDQLISEMSEPKYAQDIDASANANQSSDLKIGEADNTYGDDDSDGQSYAEPGSDPLKFINKPINSFNSVLDKAILKPTAKAYQKVTPSPVRTGVRNFFKNLREPWTAVNLLLQGNPKDSAKSLGRFTLNTVTSLGFIDIAASHHGLNIPKEDLGQTLAVWGVPNGPYLVLPLFGPSTLRDTAGMPFDSAAYPPAYLHDDAAMAGVTATDVVSLRADLLSVGGLVDPYDYELLKSVYLQNRAYEIKRSGVTSDAKQESFASEGFGD